MQVDEKPIRVIVFSGKQQDWTMWEEKFLARANKKGYKKLLVGSETAPKDGEVWDERTVEGKEKKRLRAANEAAYEDLILSIDGTHPSGRVAFNLVRLAKTRDFADGDAKLAWARLQNKYATKSAPSLMALKKEFTNSRLTNKKDDPDVWITNLEDLRVKMELQGSSMSDIDFMIHILNNLPKEYEVSQAKLEDRINDESNPLTIEEIRTELNLKFTRMSPKTRADADEEDDEGEEAALFAGGFKGICHGCGERGHKKYNCPEAGNRNKFSHESATREFRKRSTMKCAHCGKHGHTEDVCWHKHGKPEIANIGSESAELLLHAVEDEKLIAATKGFNENTWIGDSGASCHMTNDDSGMFDSRTIDEEITSGSGKPMTATKIGSIRVKSIQCDGMMRVFTMTNVKYVPELCCKLFSLTAAIDKGLKIGNKGRVLTLRKGNFKIAFDKIIKKKTGFVTGIDLITRTEEINNIESHGEIIKKTIKMTNPETGKEMA